MDDSEGLNWAIGMQQPAPGHLLVARRASELQEILRRFVPGDGSLPL